MTAIQASSQLRVHSDCWPAVQGQPLRQEGRPALDRQPVSLGQVLDRVWLLVQAA